MMALPAHLALQLRRIILGLLCFPWAPLARAQTPPCPTGSVAVDASYRRNPRGNFCWVSNLDRPSRRHGFTAGRWVGTDWVTGRVPLADPSIIRVGNLYFLTGTSDEYGNANFPIFSSPDLVRWTFHSTAFAESQRQGNQIRVADKRYCNLWAPELFVDPLHPDKITLAFSATHDEGLGICEQGFKPPEGGSATPRVRSSVDLVSSYLTQINLVEFMSQSNFGQTFPFGYRINEVDFFDGGWASQGLTGVVKGIPTTLLASLYGQSTGQTEFSGDSGRLCHNGLGCNSAIGIDVNFYVDPTNLKTHLIYTWMDGNPGVWGGLHTAAYPISSNADLGSDRLRYLDPTAQGWDHLPLAYRHNLSNPIETRVGRGRGSRVNQTPNGLRGRNGAIGTLNSGYGIAEGGAAFWDTSRQRSYWVISRNFWDSPAYGMFYRVSDHPALSSFRLQEWNQAQVIELPLLRSKERAVPCGESVGHGMLFRGPGGRTYAVFHYKEAASSGCGSSPVYPSGTPRSVFFKELTPTSQGRWVEVTNSGSWPSATTYDGYIIPR